MFSRFLQLSVAVLCCIYITGCSTYTAGKYGASVENVQEVKKIANVKISVDPFSSSTPGLNSIQCRGAGPVVAPNMESFESYISNAFISELKLAGVYAEDADIQLSGTLTKIDFSSALGGANWSFNLKATSNNGKSIEVNSSHTFRMSFVADKACQIIAQSFAPSVQHLVSDIIHHPEFKTLLNG